MNRPDTTKFLTDLLTNEFGLGKYYTGKRE